MPDKLLKWEKNWGDIEAFGQDGWRLRLLETPEDVYSLAQLDDYRSLRRGQFRWQPAAQLSLEAKVSARDLPGTWGFGFWNDPFSIGLPGKSMKRPLPTLPNAAWFFYGSSENFLSFQETSQKAGLRAATFRSPLIPSVFSLGAIPFAPLLLWPFTARIIRNLAGRLIAEDSRRLVVDVTSWHVYQLIWQREKVFFFIDDEKVFQTSISPRGKLGLVIWIDNQFMQFRPNGVFKFGLLPFLSPADLRLRNLSCFLQERL